LKHKTKNEILKEAGYTPVMGRPSVGEIWLNKLKVSKEIKDALEKKAAAMGLTIPEARRSAYEQWVSN
jgi:hypothetical protein